MIWLSWIDSERYKIDQSINGGPVQTVAIMHNMALGRRVVCDMMGSCLFEADNIESALIEAALWLNDEEAITKFSEAHARK